MGNNLLPNTFQCPNELIDSLAPELSGNEFKIAVYAARRALGVYFVGGDDDGSARADFEMAELLHGGRLFGSGTPVDRGLFPAGTDPAAIQTCLDHLVEIDLLAVNDEDFYVLKVWDGEL